MERRSKPHLRALAGPLAGRQFALSRKSLTLGRGDENDIVLDDSDLNELQAKLVWKNKRWTIINVGHDSKVFVRQIPVDRCDLQPGEPVRIGSTIFELISIDEGETRTRRKSGALTTTDGNDKAASESQDEEGDVPVEFLPEVARDRQVFIPGQSKSVQAPEVNEPASSVLPSGLERQEQEVAVVEDNEPIISSSLVYSVFIITLVLGGAAAINMVGRRPSPPPLKHVLIPEGGDGAIISVLPFGFDRIGTGEKNPRWQQIVDVKRVEPPIMVEVIGKNRGSVDVPLFWRGKEVLTLHVTVRGKEWEPPPFQPDRGMENVMLQAKSLIDKGKQLERDHPYIAIRDYFGPVVDFLGKIDAAEAKELALDAKGALYFAEDALRERLDGFEHEFWQSYYLKDYHRSLKQLEGILEWVPDGSDKRHQRAAILAADIRRKIRQQSAK